MRVFQLAAYAAVVSLVSPGEQHLTGESVRSVFNTLENRVQCGEVPCGKSCVTASDIMGEVDASSPDQRQEVGAVLGRVLYHALGGRCFPGQPLPEESFFLDSVLKQLGSENFTLEGKCPSQTQRDIDAHRDRATRSSLLQIHKTHHCFSAKELVRIHGLADNSSSALGRSGLSRLSPALIQQILSKACTDTTEKQPSDGLSTAQRYLYATLANVVITLTSMFGITVLLCTSCTNVFQMCIQFCISLAVGSLTGDALLHLLPMFLGLHVHSDESSGSGHSHDSPQDTPDHIYKMLVVIGGIYCFYLMESLFSLIMHKDNHHHHHLHEEESEPHHCDHGRVLEMYQQERKQKHKSQSTSDLVRKQKERSREQRLLPYMITIGDGIHNFADGLAMGAAFAVSWRSGLATSLAVLCHELPHELGDFAILLHSGVSVCRALLLNVGSAMVSFVGLYIALSVATDLATKQWIAAITTGLFLYVGLADMLPTLIHNSNKKPWLVFLLQNAGLLTGWAILLLLSLYEERISF
uniref:Zinc transporter ZIP4 N-terminal domain-containing protein n=1 Tax=Mola mola TaxID=94237 RepID=A0A3Q3XKA4_MOLML